MAEPLKRGLRERPRKRNLDSDKEEGEHFSYVKSYPKEFVNPSQQLNQDAKLLIKFINTANRNYDQYQHIKSERQNQTPKHTPNNLTKPPKRDENHKENYKKHNQVNKTIETELVRKGKQIYANIAQNKNYQKLNNNKSQDFLSKIKGMALASASSMLELEKSIGKNLPPVSLKKGSQQTTSKVKSEANYVIRGKQKDGNEEGSEKPVNKFQLTEQKIFKRSAYHVAIAYHIFLSQKNRSLDSSLLDPTYPARRLKQQMSKGAQ